jgi:acetoin utilization deacetylase AcuC-like enzyme
MDKKTAFLHDELCFWHTTSGNVGGGWTQPPTGASNSESPESKRRIKALLDVSGLADKLDGRSAAPATKDDLQRIHHPAYLEQFKTLSDIGGGVLGDLASFGRGSYEIACLSAGLAKQAVADVLTGRNKNAFSLSRPPGHHCLPDRGLGFCLLANIPIAIEAAKVNFGIDKVAVVDWDVHHGNGTQTIFYNRSDVLTISLHQENCFPQGSGSTQERGEGQGEGYNYNIPLLPGGGHDVYLYAMEHLVLPALRRYKPDLIIIASGLDANSIDPLGRMLLYSDSYREMTRMMKGVADELCESRLVVVHEGGYSEFYVPFCGLALMEALSDEKTEVEDPLIATTKMQQPEARFNALQKKILDEMAEGYRIR